MMGSGRPPQHGHYPRRGRVTDDEVKGRLGYTDSGDGDEDDDENEDEDEEVGCMECDDQVETDYYTRPYECPVCGRFYPELANIGHTAGD